MRYARIIGGGSGPPLAWRLALGLLAASCVWYMPVAGLPGASGGLPAGVGALGGGVSECSSAPALMYWSRGCSGSSAMIHLAIEMLRRLGMNVTTGVKGMTGPDYEAFKPKKSRLLAELTERCNKGQTALAHKRRKRELHYTSEVSWITDPEERECVARAEAEWIDRTVRAVQGRGQIWFSNPPPFTAATSSRLRALGGRVAVVYRQNVLDKLICEVRDCFGLKGKGMPRDAATGDEMIDLCIDRRKSSVAVKAELFIDRLGHHLKRYQARNEVDWEGLQTDWDGAERVSYEDLMAFQSGGMQESVKAWQAVFFAWGCDFTRARVEQMLRDTGLVDSRPAPADHATTVYNWNEVRDYLCTAENGVFASYIRDKLPCPTHTERLVSETVKRWSKLFEDQH